MNSQRNPSLYEVWKPINAEDIKQTNKQNITRDIEIQNKLIVTRGEVAEDNGGKRGKGCQGINK